MTYFVWLVIHGALAGLIYALVALAFVVVYKSTRAANFAVGEWVMLGALLTAAALQYLGGLIGEPPTLPLGLALAGVVMAALGAGFARIAAEPTRLRSPMAIIMLTLGLGAAIRGFGTILFQGVSTRFAAPIPTELIEMFGLRFPPERVLCAAIALLCIVVVTWFYHYTRAGLALRALADNPLAALGAGIGLSRYVALSWALAGLVAVVAGVLWSLVSGGGFGTALVGLKVFPIVIIGGLNSIAGCVVGAILIGVVDSLASGYLDPILGSGVSTPLSAVLLLIALWLRPHGLFGERAIVRV
jgi:branched-chain amino acid transport system permease protein